MSEILIDYDALKAFALAILKGLGVPSDHASLVADNLLYSSLRGVDSHGAQLLTFYAEQIRARNVDVHAIGHVSTESGSCLTYECENGLGQVTADQCCQHAVRVAKEVGVAFIAARSATHFGAAAFWAQRMARKGMMAIVGCNASPLVPPWQGREPRFGTNPICMAVPGQNIWLLDMATTTVAMGKIFKANLSGQPEIPAGWALDSNGAPTTSTAEAMKGMLQPLGGYKGSGLAFMVEILCAVLSGGAMSTNVGALRLTDRRMNVSHFFMAIDIARFLPKDIFEERMRELKTMVKSAKPADGYDEVLVAGEPEWRIEADRRVNGLPLNKGVWKQLVEIANSLNVQPPKLTMG